MNEISRQEEWKVFIYMVIVLIILFLALIGLVDVIEHILKLR